MEILNFIFQTIISELIIVIVGVLFAYGIKRQWDNRRYGRWNIYIHKNGKEILNRSVSPRKVVEVLDEPVDLSVFLKGVVSPFEWINCDIVSEGQELGLLNIDREERQFSINLDKNPPKKETKRVAPPNQAAEKNGNSILLNFAHPIPPVQQQQITAAAGRPIANIHNIPVHMDNGRSFPPQIRAIADAIPLTPEQWQTAPILINPPAYAPAAATMLAELHVRIGHFPPIIRIRPIPNSTPTQYELAEIINLQETRAIARRARQEQ